MKQYPIFVCVWCLYLAADSVCKSFLDMWPAFNSRQSTNLGVFTVWFADSFLQILQLLQQSKSRTRAHGQCDRSMGRLRLQGTWTWLLVYTRDTFSLTWVGPTDFVSRFLDYLILTCWLRFVPFTGLSIYHNPPIYRRKFPIQPTFETKDCCLESRNLKNYIAHCL
jgi:hypothetical protein